jgi:2-polyprenyl-6-methoxyphenol hydroxylase-like FAD-dependent oxidoreductase
VKTVLISGASISGPALAWWLSRNGFVPTLVERAPAPLKGGHAIDVRGVALDVLRAMNLLDAVYDHRTRMKGVSMLDGDGTEVWRSEEMTISGGRFDSDDIEILRDDISKLIVDKLPGGTEIIYGDSVARLEEGDDGVDVTFNRAGTRKFDLVVGADGLRSNIRKLVFGDDSRFLKPMGVALAPFSAPNTIGLRDWQLTYRKGKDSCMVYTARNNTELRVCFGFPAGLEEAVSDRAGQMALVRRRCSHMGWETPRFLDAMDTAPDFYLGLIAQVKMDHWTRGRIALVGDSGYCPSPFTGQGCSLALVGAWVLADELARSRDDHISAFARYEAKMRPYVEANHAIADLTRVEQFFSDPDYYGSVVEPALEKAKRAIVLNGLA